MNNHVNSLKLVSIEQRTFGLGGAVWKLDADVELARDLLNLGALGAHNRPVVILRNDALDRDLRLLETNHNKDQ